MKPSMFIVCLLLFVTVHAQDGDEKCGTWRLPRNVLPTHYDITIRIPSDPEGEVFTGSVKINIKTYQKTDTIVLHSKSLNITTSLITLQQTSADNKSIRVVQSIINEDQDLISLKLETQIPKDSSYILDIPEYSGVVNTWSQRGLFKEEEEYGEEKNNRIGYSTFFEPASARATFPCFDEPDMKATFTIHVERPSKYKSYSNMPLNNTIPVLNERYLDTFEESPLISTYTLGITVNDYKSYPANGTGRTRILLPEEDLKDVNRAFKIADDALLEMEKYTNIPYPLSKLDHVGFTDYIFEGMEHWGLVIYPRKVFNKMISKDIRDNVRAVQVIIHEVAHQWFGNLITMDWWSHFWLNEAFPTYFEYIIADKLVPDWRFPDQFVEREFQKAMIYDAEEEDGKALPLSSKSICDVKSSFRSLIDVSYQKGASVLKMFRGILGSEERFQKALRKLLLNGMKKNIKPNDVFSTLHEVNQALQKSHLPQGVTFNDLGVQWTEQAGVPLVTVIRNYTSGAVTFMQERFLASGKGNNSCRWWIPLTWSTGINPNHDPLNGPQDWFYEDKIISLNISAQDWLLVNSNVSGYYRVNYDEKNWLLLAQALQNSPQQFSVTNRAQILNDAVALAEANRLNINIVFNMTQFLAKEDDRIVWLSASNSLKTLFFKALYTDGVDKDNTKKRHLHRLVRRAYDMVSITLRPEGYKETHLDRLMRDTLTSLASLLHVKSQHDDVYHETTPDWLEGEV